MLGLGFPYSPAQVGLTLLTVGVPTHFLTRWASPAELSRVWGRHRRHPCWTPPATSPQVSGERGKLTRGDSAERMR